MRLRKIGNIICIPAIKVIHDVNSSNADNTYNINLALDNTLTEKYYTNWEVASYLNKAGNEYSEFERYKPWRDIDFSGKLEFENDGKTYTVFRDFNRNNCKVYDSDGNDITSEFNKDKSRGAEVGSSYFGIDEETFENTILIMQGGTSIELQSQKSIIQKLTNMIQSGQEGVSFEKIKAKLKKKYLDEIDIVLSFSIGLTMFLITSSKRLSLISTKLKFA